MQKKYEENYERYIKDIEGYPRITYKREKELAKIIQDPDTTPEAKKAAREEFVLSNLKLVITIANQVYESCRGMPDTNLSVMDLIQVGNQALIRAVELYDGNAKTRFNTYAFFSIKEKMWTAVKGTRFIRIPLNYFRRMYDVDAIEEREGEISNRALAHKMKILESTLNKIKLNRFSKVELENLMEKGREFAYDEPLLSDHIADEDQKKYVFEKIKELTSRQRTVLFYRFFSNKNVTLEEISQKLGISRQGVQQDLHTALKRIKAKILSETKKTAEMNYAKRQKKRKTISK